MCAIRIYKFYFFREAVEKKRLPLSDPEVMAAARPRIPRNSEYPIPPAKPFASANDIIMVDGRRYDTQVRLIAPGNWDVSKLHLQASFSKLIAEFKLEIACNPGLV